MKSLVIFFLFIACVYAELNSAEYQAEYSTTSEAAPLQYNSPIFNQRKQRAARPTALAPEYKAENDAIPPMVPLIPFQYNGIEKAEDGSVMEAAPLIAFQYSPIALSRSLKNRAPSKAKAPEYKAEDDAIPAMAPLVPFQYYAPMAVSRSLINRAPSKAKAPEYKPEDDAIPAMAPLIPFQYNAPIYYGMAQKAPIPQALAQKAYTLPKGYRLSYDPENFNEHFGFYPDV